ncbi:MAG: NAD(P)/FAD-dependent oxidoreductase [Sphingomonas sp.]
MDDLPGKAHPTLGKPRLIVVGAGFAGIELVKRLKHPNLHIMLIDRHNYHLFQPLLYQAATAVLAPSEIAWSIRDMFRDRDDVDIVLDAVTGIDRIARRVRLASGTWLDFDLLVIATGATHAYFGHPEWEPLAPGLKTIDDATTIRRRILLAFEEADRCTDTDRQAALLTFAIAGAGPTGVELAGMIAELAHSVLPAEYRRIDTRQARVLLIEAGDRILNGFEPGLADFAHRVLLRRGVDIRLGRPVTAISNSGLKIGDEHIQAATILWAAGVAASPAASWLAADADASGRVDVSPYLTLADDEAVFVIGDTARVAWRGGKPVPGIAPAAKQEGAYVADAIRRRLDRKKPPAPFRYRHQGDLATIGRSAAIVDFGRFRLKGVLAWWVWGLAHIYFLIGGRSRLAVALSWLWHYFRKRPSAPLITRDTHVRRASD